MSVVAVLQEENGALQRARTELMLEKEELHGHVILQDTELALRAQKLRDVQQILEEREGERRLFEEEVAALSEEVTVLRQKSATMDSLSAEVEKLRIEFAASTDAQEYTRLRDRTVAAENEQQATQRELDACRSAIVQLTDQGEAVRKELKATQDRCSAAELRAESWSKEKMQHDNSVLRSILARQKGELETCYSELKRFRRAQLAVRLAYTLFAVGLLGVAAIAWRMVPWLSEALQ
ncbi:hypothetical protein ACXR0O_22105 [Verrucomicrobiota bacterium sgz303538]